MSAAGKIHWRNTYEQLKLVGPKSLGVALLTAGFVGMVFTIQVGRDPGGYGPLVQGSLCAHHSRSSEIYMVCFGASHGSGLCFILLCAGCCEDTAVSLHPNTRV